MRKASLGMFLVAMLVLPALAAAGEYELQIVRLDGNKIQPSVPCNADPELAAIFSPGQELEVLATFSASKANECCTVKGCCGFIESGCDRCNGGYHWYTLYQCDLFTGCRINPTACPTAC